MVSQGLSSSFNSFSLFLPIFQQTASVQFCTQLCHIQMTRGTLFKKSNSPHQKLQIPLTDKLIFLQGRKPGIFFINFVIIFTRLECCIYRIGFALQKLLIKMSRKILEMDFMTIITPKRGWKTVKITDQSINDRFCTEEENIISLLNHVFLLLISFARSYKNGQSVCLQ